MFWISNRPGHSSPCPLWVDTAAPSAVLQASASLESLDVPLSVCATEVRDRDSGEAWVPSPSRFDRAPLAAAAAVTPPLAIAPGVLPLPPAGRTRRAAEHLHRPICQAAAGRPPAYLCESGPPSGSTRA